MILTHSILLVLIILIIKKKKEAPAIVIVATAQMSTFVTQTRVSGFHPHTHHSQTFPTGFFFFLPPPNLKFPNLKWFIHCLVLCSFSVPFVACAPTRQRSVLRNSRCLTVKVAVWCLLAGCCRCFITAVLAVSNSCCICASSRATRLGNQ